MSVAADTVSDVSTPSLDADIALQVRGLSTHFIYKNRVAKAVRDVSFSLSKGKTLAIVGESGSGKSVMALSVMRLLASTGQIVDGEILYRHSSGEVIDIRAQGERAMRRIRGREISMIFQEPMTSLNPLFSIGDQIGEMVQLHENLSKRQARKRSLDILKLVEIPGAERRLDDYPHQMSGGMRQRVMIAMALVCHPTLLIADEPTTALDVTIQAQILDLMRRLQADLGMSILFITHDMGVVAEMADAVSVMYAGEAVEQAPVQSIFGEPRHPYTQGLLASIPMASRDFDEGGHRNRLVPIDGTVPSLYAMPQGCVFATRCQLAESRCGDAQQLAEIGPGHASRCWKSRRSQ